MHFGLSAPCFGDDPRTHAQLAQDAEEAGWDGFFLWDHVAFLPDQAVPIVDPWVTLGMAAQLTTRIKLGVLVAALPRRRPWKVAREAVTLDRASDGRLIVGAGLGWPVEGDFEPFGEPGGVETRAGMLDEALEILDGLWSARPFTYAGDHYRVDGCTFLPGPVQRPRIPIWIAGTFPLDGPLRRASRWDGVVPMKFDDDGRPTMLTPDDARRIIDRVSTLRGGVDGFDLAIGGETSEDPAEGASIVEPYLGTGVTWWIESTPGFPGWEDDLLRRIASGPPRAR
jgi:alkanesulfonate monooxygenase SsuD/methylene tetrahydromethanopterin reductase-like flavin-dependent oxidoreductase (luciferase family)